MGVLPRVHRVGFRRDERGQLQLLESVMVALFIFVAIAVVAVFRLPSAPGTFQTSELENVAVDALKVRQAKTPAEGEDCNETPCPFATDLERLLSLALGYVGATSGSGETPDRSEVQSFLDQALPPGARYLLTYSNGVNNTQVYPVGITPPSVGVVVARTLVSTNWTIFASQYNNSVWLRIGELTGFEGVTSIQDPLNRTQNEFGWTWAGLYDEEVPLNATLGTHRACIGATCRYVTVVPHGVMGAGSQVLVTDPSSAAASVETPTAWEDMIRYHDENDDGVFDADEAVYVSLDGDGTADVGEIRLTRVAACHNGWSCPPGSSIRTGDVDAGRTGLKTPADVDLHLRDLNGDGVPSEGEPLYLFPTAHAEILAVDDVRLNRYGFEEMGTRVTADTAEPGAPTLPVDSASVRVFFWDKTGNGVRDSQEPYVLSADSTMGLFDTYLSPGGHATQRYPYDVKLVAWYGV